MLWPGQGTRRSRGKNWWRQHPTFLRRWWILSVVESVRDWFANLFTLNGVTYMALILVYVGQQGCILLFLRKYISPMMAVSLIADIPVCLHIMWYWRVSDASRAAPFQWLVYSWVHAAKVVILFCKVMPRLETPTASVHNIGRFATAVSDLYSPPMLANVLLCTPVIYTLLMFRASKAIFGSSQLRITVDLIMHYDMLWHVVMDMVDTTDMFHLSRVAEMVHAEVLENYQAKLVYITFVVPPLLFVSIVFHAQSLPGVIVTMWVLPEAPEPPRLVSVHSRAEPSSRRNLTSSASTKTQREPRRSGASSGSRFSSLPSFPRLSGSDRSEKELSTDALVPPITSTSREGSGQGQSVDGAATSSWLPHESAEPPAITIGSATEDPPNMEIYASQVTFDIPPAEDMPEKESGAKGRIRAKTFSKGMGQTASAASKTGSQLFAPQTRSLQARQVNESMLLATLGEEKMSFNRRAQLEKSRRNQLQSIFKLIQRHGICIARKRSAIVSMCFVDLPFFAVRLWLWIYSADAGHPEFPGLGVKNAGCFLLNILQFTLVRMASREAALDVQRQLAVYSARLEVIKRTQKETSEALLMDASPSRSVKHMGSCGTEASRELQEERQERYLRKRLKKLMGLAVENVQEGTVKSTSIFTHFFALVFTFAMGYLAGQGESLFRWTIRRFEVLLNDNF